MKEFCLSLPAAYFPDKQNIVGKNRVSSARKGESMMCMNREKIKRDLV
jgi:hypothetical protein